MNHFIRNFKKQKIVGLLNICTLSLGIMVAIVVGLWSINELSFDQFHKNKDRIYRIITNKTYNNHPVSIATTHRPFGRQAKEELPDVEDKCRVFMRTDHDIIVNNVWYTGINLFVVDKFFFYFLPSP